MADNRRARGREPSKAPTDAPPAKRALSRLYVGSLDKGMRVLMAFARQADLRLSDVVRMTGLDKSAAQRFLYTLTADGYLSQDPRTKCYNLTPTVLRLAHAFVHHNPLVQLAMPHLIACSLRARESVNMITLDGTETVFIARVPGPHRLDVNYSVGDHYQLYCTGGGLAFLSALAPERARALLDQIELRKLTANTVTDRNQLMKRLARAKERGFIISNQETYVGNMSVAAPVLNRAGEPVAAVNIGAPTARWTLAAAEAQLAPLIIETAARISREVD